jgi:methylenetetrahydrofolate reductase (NADPH)
VFDLDGMRLAALAAESGLAVAVAESPAAYPVAVRPLRLADKQRAGASIGILNHVSGVQVVASFAAAVHDVGGSLPLIASVAIYTDARSAAVLRAFPGLRLDDHVVDAVLNSGDPVHAGIDAAVAEARELLAIEGVGGVNISGLASNAGLEAAAEIKAEVGRQLRAITTKDSHGTS